MFLLTRPRLDRKMATFVPTRTKRRPRRGAFSTALERETNSAPVRSTKTRQMQPLIGRHSFCYSFDGTSPPLQIVFCLDFVSSSRSVFPASSRSTAPRTPSPSLLVLRFAARWRFRIVPSPCAPWRRGCKKHLQQFLHGDFRRVEPYFQRFRVPVAGADRPVRDCFLSFFRGVFDSSSSTTRLLFFFFFRAGVADGDRRDPRNGCKRFRGSPKSSQSEPQLLVLPSHRRVARRFESLGSARRFGRPRTDCNASPSRQLKRRRRGRGRKRRRRRDGRRDDETT